MVAVIEVLPVVTAVANPEELIVATATSVENQVTWLVISLVVSG
jgi:recombinational DNA repair protein RecR